MVEWRLLVVVAELALVVSWVVEAEEEEVVGARTP